MYSVDLLLETPAGQLRIDGAEVRTVRSSLVPVSLKAVIGAGAHGTLSSIEMVPVLGPLQPFVDRADVATEVVANPKSFAGFRVFR